ncbi:MAG: hypothetical protein CL472_08255 [Acidobacteria bacterium]|nr:hypothetical protein [Acidobacteriota bacterium]
MEKQRAEGRGENVEGYLALAAGSLYFVREGRSSLAIFPSVKPEQKFELEEFLDEAGPVWISGRSEGGVEGGIIFESISEMDPERAVAISLADEVCIDQLREQSNSRGSGIKAFGIDALLAEADRISEALEKEGFPPLPDMDRDPDKYETFDMGTTVKVRPVGMPISAVDEGTRIEANIGVSLDSRPFLKTIEVDSIAFEEKNGEHYRDRIASMTIHDGNIDMDTRRATTVFAVMKDDEGLYAAMPARDIPKGPIAVSRIAGGDDGFDLAKLEIEKGDPARFVMLPVKGKIGAGDVTIGDGNEYRQFRLESATKVGAKDYAEALQDFKENGPAQIPERFTSKGLEDRLADDRRFIEELMSKKAAALG